MKTILARRMRQAVSAIRSRLRTIVAGFVLTAFALSLIALAVPPDRERLISAGQGLVILSREGNELRRFRESDAGSHTSHRRGLDAYPPALLQAVLRAEDRRFYLHPGVDPAAILRATLQNLRAGRVVSGGSTITQQLARLVYKADLPDNAYARKLAEWFLAVRLDLHTTKDDIFSAYLNRVPLPGNRTGMTAGAAYLFQREPRFLNRDECIALAVLIRRNHTNPESFQTRFRRLAAHFATEGASPEASPEILKKIFDRKNSAKIAETPAANTNNPEEQARRRTPGHSPHFTDWLREKFPNLKGVVQTRLSENLNETVQNILKGELTALKKLNARHAAVVVLRIDALNESLILEGLVGSRDYGASRSGQINGATTRRVAGSTLKPFIYGLAFEEQNLRPYSIIHDNDSNVSLGAGAVYRPRNYDLNYWGAMTAREALATSRNIPAVKLTEELGEERVFEFLRKAGFFPTQPEAQPYAYGPGIALGISGATLLDLTRAYSTFATGGRQWPLRLGRSESGDDLIYGDDERLFNESTAHLITHILSDRSMRRRAFGDRSFLDFPFEVAAKTGTSKDYRDAWTVGYSENYVVGVWVGNFDATPMKNVSGAYGAGRIFHQIMRGLHRNERPRFHYPADWSRVSICRHTGLRASDSCESYSELIPPEDVTPALCHGEHTGKLTPGATDFAGEIPDATKNSTVRRHLLSPTPGAVYYLDPHSPRSIQEIPLRLHAAFQKRSGKLSIDYPVARGRRLCQPAQCPPTLKLDPGSYEIRVLDRGRILERVEFEVR
ncbi:MAG: transglycosylase domain-containing protein [bacterium]|nr:transglycosylase domain-containing protein [bacterium]